jgi:hypothetical protein
MDHNQHADQRGSTIRRVHRQRKAPTKRVVFGVLIVLITGLTGLGLAEATGSTTDFTGATSGSTYVWSGSPTTAYGSPSVLNASFRSYRALLQFATPIPDGATVDSASLTIEAASTGSGNFLIHPEGSFSPSATSWASQPTKDTTVLGTSSAPTNGSTLTIALTGLDPSPTVNLAVTYSTPGVVAKLFGGPTNSPILTVTVTGSDGTTTTTITSTTGAPSTTTTGVPDTTPTTTPPTTTTTAPPASTTTSTTKGAPSTTTTTTSTTGASNPYCAGTQPAPTTKLLVIYEENESASAIYNGTDDPNIDTYMNDCGYATNYLSLTHPSLPNYLASTSGLPYDTTPWVNDCQASSSGCQTSSENIFDQVGPSGWKAYAQSMPTACDTSNSGAYLSRHNPAVYYTDLGAACAADDVDSGTPTSGALATDIANGTLPTFSTLTPDVNNDEHNGTLAQADAYLGSWIPQIVAGPDYSSGQLAIVIVYDEGSGSGTDVSSTVPAIVMSRSVAPGTVSTTGFTHYSLLKAAEDIAQVPELNNAAAANDLRAAFGF